MTSTTWTTDRRPTFSVGAVVSDTLATLGATGGQLALVALPFIVLPQALASLVPEDARAVSVAAGLPSLIFQGAAVTIAYGHLSGRPIALGDAVRRGTQKFGALWGSGILTGLGMALGLLLLIAPGILLMAAWIVYQPVLMIEDVGATASLDRSWAMTKGVRWPLAAVVGLGIVASLLWFALLFASGFGLALALGVHTGTLLGGLLAAPVLIAGFTALCTVGTTAVYVQLKRARDGALPGEIAEVFS